MENCIFCKIARGDISKEFTYEDEDVIVFPDLHPVKPIHLLIIPKNHVKEVAAVEDPALFSKLFQVVQKVIEEQGLGDKGYRIVINGGGAQEVDHLHIHLMGPMKAQDA